MRKTRKLLSFVLAMVVALASMPVVYTGTAAADYVTAYATGKTGTKDNPTRPVDATGSIEKTDLYKMNINSQSTAYTFYQTVDDEYFTFGQTQGLQNYYETSVSSRTLTFESISFYKGASDMGGSTEPKEIAAGSGMWESPLITDNPTSDFLSRYYVSNKWSATNSNASEKGSKPENFVLAGSWADIGGCKVYTWQNDVVFKGNPSDVKGEINTGYYEQLFWNWVNSDATEGARFDLRIGTTIRVLDAREFAKELAEAEEILANPENYTDSYISSVKATVNTVPEDLRDFSKVYNQSDIDKYTEMLEDISLNSADYREFNETYEALKGITNAKGAYTEESFEAFVAEIERINKELPKNLDKTQQKIVDDATQALMDAFDSLVATDLSGSDTPYNYDSGDGKNIVINVDNTAFCFMQTKDNQEFVYEQNVLVYRTGGSTARKFRGLIIDETGYHGSSECVNNSVSASGTADFLSHLDSSCYASTNGYSDENDTSVSAKEFTCVTETKNENWRDDQSFDTAFVTDDGRFGYNKTLNDYGIFGSGPFEYRSAVISPVFRGNAKGVYGELNLSYALRAGFSTNSGLGYSAKQWHTHIPTTIKVTDVRQLISAVEEAEKTLANPGTHSEGYITALQAAVDSVPVEMLRGVEYYTQAEVDKFYNDITSIPEEVADYSEFVEVFNMMTSLNKDKYTEESYSLFIDEIYAINKNLPKNLDASQQDVVDAAVESLYAAYDKLVSGHLNNDNVFTQDDISDLGNSPLEFTLSSTQYNFMQTVDGQKFAIRTDLTARNTKTRYTCNLLSLGFSIVSADTVSTICAGRTTPDAGCHNGEAITINQTEIVANAVSGVNALTYTDGVLAYDDAGDITEHNTWVNTEGVPLSTNGIFNDPTTLSTSDSSAYAEIYYTGPTGNHEAYTGIVDATFAYRLGWSYHETVLGVEGESIRRHVHIPVNVKVTDARALHYLYNEVGEILDGKSETNYTFESLVKLYNAYEATDEDIANGNVYADQATTDAQYNALKAVYDELKEGADYSEYFEAYIEAKEIIDSGNDDGYGNKLYEEEAFQNFVDKVTEIDNALDKDLEANDSNQAEIDKAVTDIRNEIANLKSDDNTYADYTELEKAIEKADEIANAEEGTYTDKTLDALKELLEQAKQLDKNLPASEQEGIDNLASALNGAIEDMEFKADYSEYDKAYDKVKDIIDNPDNYTDETVEAAEAVMGTSGSISKDLADTAENRVIIKEATDELNNVLNGVKEKADYSDFNEAYKQVEEIAKDTTGKYTDETVQSAKDALAEADKLDKNLEKNEENQAEVDKATGKLEEMLGNVKEKADYTDYNTAKDEADKLENDGSYDEEAFNEYKNAVEALDKELSKNLSDDEQNIVDEKTQEIKDLRTELDATKGYEESVIDPETDAEELKNDVLAELEQNQGYTADELIVEFRNYLGEELADEGFVGTGSTMRVILKSTGELVEYKLFIVMGDVDGDGAITDADYEKAVNVGLEEEEYSDEHRYFFVANDVAADGVIDVLDAFEIRRMAAKSI